jgi:hypothetical protein
VPGFALSLLTFNIRLLKIPAQILARVGQTCTHVIFKNGLMSTISRYRYVVELLARETKINQSVGYFEIPNLQLSGSPGSWIVSSNGGVLRRRHI